MIIETGKLYKVIGDNQFDGSAQTVGIRLGGVGLSCIIYGSQVLPANVSDMENIRNPESPDAMVDAGWRNFRNVPKYITFVGTALTIETSNFSLKLIGDIS
jgi:hypothetical protein